MYAIIRGVLIKFKGLQLNYDTAMEQIAIELNEEITEYQKKAIKRILKEIREEMIR